MTLVDRIGTHYEISRPLGTDGGCVARIDDWRPSDCYPGFCTISAACRPDGAVRLTLTHPPIDDHVREVVSAAGGRITCRKAIEILIDLPPIAAAADVVRELADAIRAVIDRPVEPYADRNWKWIAPRTAATLIKFARLLDRHYR